jgi:hypothetical protein
MSEFIIKDVIQEHVDTSQHPFLKEFILFASLYLFYNNTEGSIFIIFAKYALILIFSRFLLNVLTERRDKTKDKRYFVLNAHVILMTLICLLSFRYNVYGFANSMLLTWVIIISYSLLVISTREHYTSDVIISILIVLGLFDNVKVRSYIEDI